MPNTEKPSGPKPRVNYLRRRPRPGGLVRPPDDLALPHERDQTEQGMTDGKPSAEGRQAHKDVERGLEDTSKSVEMDETYRQQKP